MNFGELLFALNSNPLKTETRKIEKINKLIVQTKNDTDFNDIYDALLNERLHKTIFVFVVPLGFEIKI